MAGAGSEETVRNVHTNDGIGLEYTVLGSGPNVVLLHGAWATRPLVLQRQYLASRPLDGRLRRGCTLRNRLEWQQEILSGCNECERSPVFPTRFDVVDFIAESWNTDADIIREMQSICA